MNVFTKVLIFDLRALIISTAPSFPSSLYTRANSTAPKTHHQHSPIPAHSHTFENKSSLPPNPAEAPPEADGFPAEDCIPCSGCGGGFDITGLTGAALLQPPNSSSGATWGACVGRDGRAFSRPLADAEGAPKPELLPKSEAPHPKSLPAGAAGMEGEVWADGLDLGRGGLVVGAVDVSGVDQTSLVPQGSAMPLEGARTGGGFFDTAWGWLVGLERLKTEERSEAGVLMGWGGRADWVDGAEKSKRSLT